MCQGKDCLYKLQSRSVHHQHRDYASEKDEKHNCQADKNSIANGVGLLSLIPDPRHVAKPGGRSV